MNSDRIRIKAKKDDGFYHCVSRIVGRQWLLGEKEKGIFSAMLFKVAEFSGVEVITFCVMDDHFHLLIKVPAWRDIPDAELLRRMLVLYKKDDFLVAHFIDKLKERVMRADALILPDAEFEKEREAMVGRMYELSEFMKCLKQRFSIWYNRNHDRMGTLYADRFQSVIIEENIELLAATAAYIDLNPVRAGICHNPTEYHWCGMGWGVSREASGMGCQLVGVGMKEEEGRMGIRCEESGVGSGKMSESSSEKSGKVEEKLEGKMPFHALLGEVRGSYCQIVRDLLSEKGNVLQVGEDLRARDRELLQGKLEAHDVAFVKDHPVSSRDWMRSRCRMFVAGTILGSMVFIDAIGSTYELANYRKVLGPRSGPEPVGFSKKFFYRRMRNSG